MAVVISDLFNRADNATTLGVADTGQAWTALRGVWGISANQAYTPNNVDAVAVIDAAVSDCTVQMTYPVANSGHYMVFRCVDADNFLALHMGSSLGNYTLYKREAGVLTSLAVATGGSAAGDVITVDLVGSSITVKRGGTVLLTATSALFPTATKYGMFTTSATRRFDSFSVSTAAAAMVRVGRECPLTWQVRQAVSRQAPLGWAVRQAVSRQAPLTWAIRQAVSRVAPLGWQVRQGVSRLAPLRWSVRASVSRVAPLTWQIRQSVSRTAPLTWQIRQSVGRAAPLTWQVRQAVGRAVLLQWAIDGIAVVFVPIVVTVSVLDYPVLLTVIDYPVRMEVIPMPVQGHTVLLRITFQDIVGNLADLDANAGTLSIQSSGGVAVTTIPINATHRKSPGVYEVPYELPMEYAGIRAAAAGKIGAFTRRGTIDVPTRPTST